MTSANDPHPNLTQLTAFDLGQLGPAEWSAVESHVARCAECCARLEALPEDTLVSLLRSTADLARARQPDTGDYTTSGAGTSGPPVAQPVPPELTNHPRYRLCGVIGSGGMGTVYKAEHLLMGRTVALKVIHRNLTDHPGAVERFPREVKAAARLSHPNIVTAYDAEQAGALHFLVMEYVEGKSLDRVIAEEGPVPVARACDWVRQAALGLLHAHERGMVHRDIKPHNLLLTASPVASAPGVIKILDFGLARFASTTVPAEGLTPSGVVVGTPDYMAPEQALQPQHADIRSDIYSLGCTLYHLLAGRPPFAGGTPMQKLMAQQEHEPVPLRTHRQDIPDGLDAVLRRMMAKDPARRYQTPAEVAEALAPFARGEADESHTAEIVFRPTARRSWRRAILAGGLLAAVVMVAGLVWALTRNGGRDEDTGGKQVRVIGGEEWGPFSRVAISDDCRFGLSGNEDFTVGLWDLEEGKELCRLDGHKNTIFGLAFSRDGKRALSGGQDHVVCFWDLEQRKRIAKLREHTSWARGVTFTLDDQRGLSAGNDGRAIYWDLSARMPISQLRGHQTVVWCVAASPSGRIAASGSGDQMIWLWDLFDQKSLRRLEGHTHTVVAVAFSPDGQQLLSGSGDTTMRLWDVQTGNELRVFRGHEGGLTGVAFSRDGRLALSAGTDGTARLWNVATGEELHCFRGHTGVVHRAVFMPDGRHIVTGGKDGTFRVWSLPAAWADGKGR